jgi:hypothetical protein
MIRPGERDRGGEPSCLGPHSPGMVSQSKSASVSETVSVRTIFMLRAAIAATSPEDRVAALQHHEHFPGWLFAGEHEVDRQPEADGHEHQQRRGDQYEGRGHPRYPHHRAGPLQVRALAAAGLTCLRHPPGADAAALWARRSGGCGWRPTGPVGRRDSPDAYHASCQRHGTIRCDDRTPAHDAVDR